MPVPLIVQREKYQIGLILEAMNYTKIQFRRHKNGNGYYVATVVFKNEEEIEHFKDRAKGLHITQTAIFKTTIHNYNGAGYSKHGEIVVPPS